MVNIKEFEACKIGDLESIKNADSVQPDLTDYNGAGCLHYAARGGSLQVVQYLIESADFSPMQRSNTGSTALHDAAARGNTAIVKWLVEKCDVDVDDQDGVGITALHLAACYCHPLTVEWLLDEASADESVRTGSGATPLVFAVVGGDLNCVKLLMDENPRLVNMQLNNGATPLYIACQNGFLDIAQYLHSRNAATKIKAYDGMSCLHAAAQQGHIELVKWLIQLGECNPNERDFDGATPLHFAASRGHSDIVRWLLDHGGARITLDNLGGSPLHSAAEMGELEAVQALLETGCDVTLVDNSSLTAAQLADKCDQSEAAALIRGEVTLEQLFIADASPEEFQHPEQSPRLSFPPPPLFPPEEEPEEISYNSLTKAIQRQNLEEGTVNIQSSVETATSAATGNPLRREQPTNTVTSNPLPREPSQALSDSPPPYPSPPPPDWLDSPDGDSSLPPPPPSSPPAPLYLQPYPEEGLESSEQGRQPLPLVDNTFTPTSTTSTTGAYSNSNSTSGYSNHTGSERHLGVRRTISAVSVDSSASDPVGFEITTVTADVHKSRGSIDSINGLQTLAYSSNDSINNSNIITVSNGKANAPFQKRKFSVLKYLSKTQDAQIQEKPELENNNSIDQRNHTNGPNSAHGNSVDAYSYSRSGVTGRRYSSTRQRPPSPGLPTPPPLSLQSNSFHDLSTTPPTSYNSHDTEFPPPPPSLPPASALKDSHHLPFEQAESWSLSEELPPPPPISNSQSSGQDFTDDLPPPPSHFTTASSNSSHNNHTSSAASTSSTSHFKQYFDSGTRASFARAKAIFGAFSEANTGDGNVGVRGYSKSTGEGRKQSARPHSYPSQHCINPDSGEVEFGPLCDKIKKNIVNRGVSSKSQPQEFPPPPRFLMDASAESSEAQEKNASATPTSPTLSDQSGLSTESAQSEDSVLSVVTRQGGHVTIISMSGAKDADSPSKPQARDQGAVDVKDQQSDHASPGSQVIKGENSTRAPVPVSIHTKKSPNALQGAGTGQNDGAPLAVSQTPAASSNGVVMRAGNGQGAGRAKARTVVSAGPELLNGKDKGQTSARSSQPVNPGIVRRKNDLIADIQSAVSGTSNLSLRPARSRGEGVSMVYSSKRHSTGQDQSKMVDTTKPLTGQFDPKNFLDEIEKVDSSGRAIPEWRRHVLAKHAAEKAQKEFEEKRVVDDYEARFKDMPAWKRALIERREALAREEEAASKK